LEVFFFFWEKKVPFETKNSEGVGEESEERKLEKTVKRNCEGVFCELSVVFGSKKKRIRPRKKMKKTRDVENVDAVTARKSRAKTRTRKS